MLQFESTQLQQAIVHYVGNRENDSTLFLSQNGIDTQNALLEELFLNSFTKPFKDKAEFHQFTHTSDLQLNEMYNYASQIFKNNDVLNAVSQDIAKHLYEKTVHPKVNGGEVYVALFDNVIYEDELTSALGIFKTENKEVFLKAEEGDVDYVLEPELGVNLSKLDKGCFIINSDKDKGYRVLIIDNLSRGYEAQYWKEDFLNLQAFANDYHFTKQYMTLAKDFVTKEMPKHNDVDRTDQIDMLKRSVSYFKDNESFEIEQFAENVLQDEGIKASFMNYKTNIQASKNVELADHFEISDSAVKKQERAFKSIIKLDKNFHVYVHGDQELLSKGKDPDGRKFYKLYYEKEA
jgi:hypothetical protein